MNPTTTTEEFDPFQSASDPKVPTFELFGMIEINAWACALVKGQGKVPYDANVHDKRFTAIDVFIQPLAEIVITNTKACERHWLAESKEWANITLRSIKEAGIENVREIHGKWARIASVPNGKTYPAKDSQGNLTGEMKQETTFKFVEFYPDETACRAAYLANGGQPSNGHNVSVSGTVTTPEDAERLTALAFLKVIVGNAVRGKTDLGEAKDAAGVAIMQYPTVSKYFNADSAETLELIAANLKA